MKKTTLLLLLCLAPRARGLTAPQVPLSVNELHSAFLEAVETEKKTSVLEQISHTAPQSNRDITSLFDLFMRFPDNTVREAVLRSLDLLGPRASNLEDMFVGYLDQPEPEAKLFGIKGALRIRSAKALPLVRRMAERPFPFKDVQETDLLGERNAWWTQYESLAALTQWQGEETLPLLKKRAGEAPAVARIMSMYLWKQSLPQLVKWARSGNKNNQEKARQALEATVPDADLRATREDLLKILRDRKAPKRLRHPIALKVGLCTQEPEVAALLAEREAQKDPESRLLYAAALFASRSPQVVPLLLEFAKTNPDPRTREGARTQLKDMLPAKDFRALMEWAAQSEPDPDLRQDAQKELKDLATPAK